MESAALSKATDNLEYEPSPTGRPVYVEHNERGTRIIVPMTGLYAPILAFVCDLHKAKYTGKWWPLVVDVTA